MPHTSCTSPRDQYEMADTQLAEDRNVEHFSRPLPGDERVLAATGPGQIAELLESVILPCAGYFWWNSCRDFDERRGRGGTVNIGTTVSR